MPAREDLEVLNVEQLRQHAADLNVEGRSKMDKDELVTAVQDAMNEAERVAATGDPRNAPDVLRGNAPAGNADSVPLAEYERVVQENAQLRAQLNATPQTTPYGHAQPAPGATTDTPTGGTG